MSNNEQTTDNETSTDVEADTEGHGRFKFITEAGDEDTESHIYVPKDERLDEADTEGHGKFRFLTEAGDEDTEGHGRFRG